MASSNAGAQPMQTPSAVAADAMRVGEPTGMAVWGAAGDPKAVDQVFAEAAFEWLEAEPIAVSTGE
jgi:hypothetical protein